MKLEPCPWCKKTPDLWEEEDPHYPGGPVVIGHYIECSGSCDIKMSDESKKDLIERWNKHQGASSSPRIHIIRWKATKTISGVYSDHEKAKRIASKKNDGRSWAHTLLANTKWEVKTFKVTN